MKRFAKNEYVVWVEFSGEFNDFLIKKCQELEKHRIKPGVRPPHLTLTFIKTNNCDELISYTKAFVKENSVKITINSIGMFKKRIIFYQPEANKSLLQYQNNFCKGLSDSNKLSWNLYYPDNWTPHIALTGALSKQNSLKALEIMQNGFSPVNNLDIGRILIKNCKTGEIILELPLS